MEILLLNYCSVAVILEHAGTGLELGTSWNPAVGSSESNSGWLAKVFRPGIEPVATLREQFSAAKWLLEPGIELGPHGNVLSDRVDAKGHVISH